MFLVNVSYRYDQTCHVRDEYDIDLASELCCRHLGDHLLLPVSKLPCNREAFLGLSSQCAVGPSFQVGSVIAR